MGLYDTLSRQRLDSGGRGGGARTGKLWLRQCVVDYPALGVCVEFVPPAAATIDDFLFFLLSFIIETASEIKDAT